MSSAPDPWCLFKVIWIRGPHQYQDKKDLRAFRRDLNRELTKEAMTNFVKNMTIS